MTHKKKWLSLIVVILIGAVFFASGFYFGKKEKIVINPLEDADFRVLNQVYDLIEKNHPEFDNVDDKDLAYGAVKGMLEALGDDHTAFLTPERSKIFMEDVSGEFQGVGIEIGVREGEIRVISPVKGTPAYKAGIKSGDVITAIDGEPVEDITIEEVVVAIRGPKGTEVVLEIKRDGETRDISITRDVIEMPSMKWELIEKEIAYIQLFSFHENTKKEFSTVAEDISESSASKIILDLRGNPGGVLDIAIDIASYFLEPGKIVLLTGEKRSEDNTIIKRSFGVNPLFSDYPVVVLINEGSASASEILAGALKDQRDAVVVGKQSFGKGSIQTMQTLIDGSVLKITERYFFTPNGSVINEKGISPDIKVELTEEDVETEKDPQLKKAVEAIKNINNK